MPATTRKAFFAKRGYVGKQRNTVTVNGEWLANTTMQKTLGASAAPGVRHEPRTPLSVRHHAARRRADQRRRFHAARQATDRRHARRTRHRLCRGRLSRRQSDRHRILCREAKARSCPLHGVRHDPASRPFGLERSGSRGAAGSQGRCDLLCRQIVGLSGAGGAGDHQRGKSRLDPRQRQGREGRRPRSDARLRAFLRRLQGKPGIRAGLRQGGLRFRRALGGAVRHQWRHHAARGRDHRRRGDQAYPRRPCRHSRP